MLLILMRKRRHDPERMIQAYNQAASTQNLLGHLHMGLPLICQQSKIGILIL